MDKNRLEYFREKLLSAKRDVLERVKRSENYGRQASEKEENMDLVDRASSSYSKEFFFSLSESDRKLLNMIESALKRIENGSYGYCQHTGEPIESRRLEAIPWAHLSRKAQEMEEQGRL